MDTNANIPDVKNKHEIVRYERLLYTLSTINSLSKYVVDGKVGIYAPHAPRKRKPLNHSHRKPQPQAHHT